MPSDHPQPADEEATDARMRSLTLTVAQVISMLQKLPPDAPVFCDYDGMRELIGAAELHKDGWVELLPPGSVRPEVAAELGLTVVLGERG